MTKAGNRGRESGGRERTRREEQMAVPTRRGWGGGVLKWALRPWCPLNPQLTCLRLDSRVSLVESENTHMCMHVHTPTYTACTHIDIHMRPPHTHTHTPCPQRWFPEYEQTHCVPTSSHPRPRSPEVPRQRNETMGGGQRRGKSLNLFCH